MSHPFSSESRSYPPVDSPTEVIDPVAPPRDGEGGPETGDGRKKPQGIKARRRRRVRRILLTSLIVLVVLAAGGTIVAWQYARHVENEVTRVDAFDPTQVPEAERPAKPAEATQAMNILVLGSDSRDPDETGSRADTIMLAHVTADHKTSQIVSIPRDTWVDIPKTADGKQGGVKGKINWSFAWGGIPLMVRAVESYTKVRIDHVIVIDFAGFQQVVDAVGGIDIDNDVTFTSYFWENNHHVFEKGRLHLNGVLALDYARQRKMLKNGDFDRIKHQQMVVKAVLDKATSAGVVADPTKLTAFLTAIAKTITTDRDFNLLSTAMDLRGIKSSQIKFITSPSKGTGMVGDQSVVFPDPAAAGSLFAALTKDQAASWTNPSQG